MKQSHNFRQSPADLYEQYKRKQKRKNNYITLSQIIFLFLGIFLWEIGSNSRILDPLLFSSPTDIVHYLQENISNGYFFPHIYTTLFEVVVAFIISTVIGVIVAIMMWWNHTFSKIIDPFLVIFNAIPKVALGPVLIIIFGPNMNSSIAMGVIISIVVTILVVYESFRGTDQNFIKLMNSFGATRLQIFTKCIFPSSINTMISAIKVNVGLAWVGVIVGEYLVSREGLGYTIVYGFQIFNFTLVWSSLVIISIFAAVMYFVVDKVEKYVHSKNNFKV